MAKSQKKFHRCIEPEQMLTYACYVALIIAWNRFNCTNLVGGMSLESDNLSDSESSPAAPLLDPWDIDESPQDIITSSGPMVGSTSSGTDFVASNTADTQPIQGWQYYCWNSTVGYEVCEWESSWQSIRIRFDSIRTCVRIIANDNVNIIEATHWDFSRGSTFEWRRMGKLASKKKSICQNKQISFICQQSIHSYSVYMYIHKFAFSLKRSTKQENCARLFVWLHMHITLNFVREKEMGRVESLRKFNFVEFKYSQKRMHDGGHSGVRWNANNAFSYAKLWAAACGSVCWYFRIVIYVSYALWQKKTSVAIYL